MKIEIESTWCMLYDKDTGQKLISLYQEPVTFYSLLRKILTPSQLYRLEEKDYDMVLSKKREKILFEEIEKLKNKK